MGRRSLCGCVFRRTLDDRIARWRVLSRTFDDRIAGRVFSRTTDDRIGPGILRMSTGGLTMLPRGSLVAAPLGVDSKIAPGGFASEGLGPKASAGVNPIARKAVLNTSFFMACSLSKSRCVSQENVCRAAAVP